MHSSTVGHTSTLLISVCLLILLCEQILHIRSTRQLRRKVTSSHLSLINTCLHVYTNTPTGEHARLAKEWQALDLPIARKIALIKANIPVTAALDHATQNYTQDDLATLATMHNLAHPPRPGDYRGHFGF